MTASRAVRPSDDVEPVVCTRRRDGVAVLTMRATMQGTVDLDDAGAAVRVLETAIDRLEARHDAITGVVLTSPAGQDFGGGLAARASAGRDCPGDSEPVFRRLQIILRRLETFGRPVVAAIAGPARGPDFELALAAHHRVAVATVGRNLGPVRPDSLPGLGGITRTVRTVGLERTLDLLLGGHPVAPAEALTMHLIDDVAELDEGLVPSAAAWICAHPDVSAQPWDRGRGMTRGDLRGFLDRPDDAARTGRRTDQHRGRLAEVIRGVAAYAAAADFDSAIEHELATHLRETCASSHVA